MARHYSTQEALEIIMHLRGWLLILLLARSLIPGPTHYAVARICDPASSFALLLMEDILQHIVSMTNLHGRRSIAEWRDMDTEELQAYVGLLILAGVYRSKNESTLSLWSEKSGWSIFRATMSHKRFHQISRTLRFDDKLSRPRRRDDKLAAFRKVWDMCAPPADAVQAIQ
ncbi:PiggyBac transposable element-derived protein 4 [Dissostichus eleginoides]|uniref:PiggyBac transposable element-derived protein 4 n=1 Tax=Dissostichus eleginoides TaxID=100907 RepID=A0AAD9B5U6_DISEL|nr:PiggyBac transposable element-derived protein 4 [Dissostichus eleginoides]